MAESSNGAERRKYHRIATDQVISFAEIDQPEQLGLSKDLSTGGIRFEAVGVEINLGDVLRVTFKVGDQTVVAAGKVVLYCSGRGSIVSCDICHHSWM